MGKEIRFGAASAVKAAKEKPNDKESFGHLAFTLLARASLLHVMVESGNNAVSTVEEVLVERAIRSGFIVDKAKTEEALKKLLGWVRGTPVYLEGGNRQTEAVIMDLATSFKKEGRKAFAEIPSVSKALENIAKAKPPKAKIEAKTESEAPAVKVETAKA